MSPREQGVRRALHGCVVLVSLAILIANPWAGSSAGMGHRADAGVRAGPGGIPGTVGLARDPAVAGGGIGIVNITTSDPRAVPNDGLMTNLTGFRVDPFPSTSAFQIGAQEVLGPYLAAFGLFQNSPVGPFPFFSVFNATTGSSVYQVNESYAIVQTGDAYDFALVHAAGGNWTLLLNGEWFGNSRSVATFDFKVSEATNLGGIGFTAKSLATGVAVPREITVPTAIGVHLATGWYLPAGAVTEHNGSASFAWGIEGTDQSGALLPGEISTGTDLPVLANGTGLWSGGAVPGTLTLSADPSSTRGTGTALLSVQLTGVPGRNGSDVPIALSDSGGGIFGDPFPFTDSNGAIQTAFVAPNVSAAGTDLLWAIPRTLGLVAVGTTQVNLTPAIHVELVDQGGGSLRPGTNISFAWKAIDPNGSPVPDLVVELSVVGGAVAYPNAVATDPSGTARSSIATPAGTGSVTITLVVVTPGYWGKHRQVLEVTGPPTPLADRLLAVLPWVLGILAVAGAAFLLLRRRPPRTALPPMDLARLAARRRVAGRPPSEPDPKPPEPGGPTRTPP